MKEFCTKANITGYAKIALDTLNETVVNTTSTATAAAKTTFSYNDSTADGAVNFLIFIFIQVKFFLRLKIQFFQMNFTYIFTKFFFY